MVTLPLVKTGPLLIMIMWVDQVVSHVKDVQTSRKANGIFPSLTASFSASRLATGVLEVFRLFT